MMRYIWIICWSVWGALCVTPLAAQTVVEPFLEAELDETEVVPGQPVTLRVTVLVPTWLAQPIEFPSLEAPDLLVKLFEKSTTAMSRTIDGETWSGVSRAYRLSPMVPGVIEVPAQEVRVLWAEPGQTDPNTSVLSIDGISIRGTLPDGGEDLTPFIAANDVQLTQELSTDARVLKPGESLTRTVTAEITGASPFVLSQLLTASPIQGIASYPAEPVVTEDVQDQWLSGTRVESVSMVAESGGDGTVPPVELRWFNLQTGEIETATAEGFDLSVDAPVARDLPALDAQFVLRLVTAGLGVLAVVYLFWRFGRPRVQAYFQARTAAYQASEAHAYDVLHKAIRRKKYAQMMEALSVWRARLPHVDDAQFAKLQKAVTDLGECLYGRQHSDTSRSWQSLDDAVRQVRRAHAAPDTSGQSLMQMPVNPTSA